MSNQGDLQQSIRDSTSTTETHNGDWLEHFDDDAIAAGTFNERMIGWIKTQVVEESENINGLKAQFAADVKSYPRWNDVDGL